MNAEIESLDLLDLSSSLKKLGERTSSSSSKSYRESLAETVRNFAHLITDEDLQEDLSLLASSGENEETSISLFAYDDGILPGRVPTRADIPELDQRILSALHIAVRDCKLGLVEALLKTEQVDVNITDPAFQTPLHYACSSIGEQTIQVIETLIKYGANVNAKDFLGSTPLHNAVRSRNNKVVKYLVTHSGIAPVYLNPSDYNMSTPLHIAVSTSNYSSAKILLEAGADHGVLNNENRTPFMIAKELNKVEFLDLFIRKMDQGRFIDTNKIS